VADFVQDGLDALSCVFSVLCGPKLRAPPKGSLELPTLPTKCRYFFRCPL
jgi:hypothetical protein